MSIKTTEWTICKWEDRETANFYPICQAIDGKLIDNYGRNVEDECYQSATPRRHYKMDVQDQEIYICYEDGENNPVPIIKITDTEAINICDFGLLEL